MYSSVMTIALSTQYSIAQAYVASGRALPLGLYLLSFGCMTLEFFEQLEPTPEVKELHDCFLQWQTLALRTLTGELEIAEMAGAEESARYLQVSQQLSELMESLIEKEDAL